MRHSANPQQRPAQPLQKAPSLSLLPKIQKLPHSFH